MAATDLDFEQERRAVLGRALSRRLLAAFFIGAGVNHFVNPRFYEAIVPPSLQDEASGSCGSAAWPSSRAAWA